MLRTCFHLSVVGLFSLAGFSAARAQPSEIVNTGVQISLRPAADLLPGGRMAAPATPAVTAPRDVRFGSDVPSLRVNTEGPDTLVVGKPAEYRITLGNQSEFSANHIVVRVQMPSWVELKSHQSSFGAVQRKSAAEDGSEQLVWNVEQIAGHGEQTLALMLVPRAGRAFELGVDVSVRPTASATKIAVREPKLNLQLTGTEEVISGEPATWAISFENPGTGDAHNVRLDLYSDSEKLGTQAIGTLEAGSRRVVDIVLPTLLAGQQGLRAVAVAEPALTAEASAVYLVRRGELNVQVRGPGFEYAGTEATYEVRVSNSGDAAAHDVRMEFFLPRGAKYIGRLGAGDATADDLPSGLHWTVAEIQPGREEAFRIACQLREPGEHQATIRAASVDGLSAAAELSTQVQAAADLQLQVIDPTGPRGVGTPVEIEVRVTNRGTDAARGVYVSAECAAEIELVDVTGTASIEAGQIFFQPIEELAAGETVSHRVTVRAASAGGHAFRATVECDDPESRLVCEESTRFFLRDETSPAENRMAAPLPIRKINIR